MALSELSYNIAKYMRSLDMKNVTTDSVSLYRNKIQSS